MRIEIYLGDQDVPLFYATNPTGTFYLLPALPFTVPHRGDSPILLHLQGRTKGGNRDSEGKVAIPSHCLVGPAETRR